MTLTNVIAAVTTNPDIFADANVAVCGVCNSTSVTFPTIEEVDEFAHAHSLCDDARWDAVCDLF